MLGASCFHTSLPYNKQIIAAVEAAIRSSLAPIDWNNRHYALTCDNTAKTPVNVAFSGGNADCARPRTRPLRPVGYVHRSGNSWRSTLAR